MGEMTGKHKKKKQKKQKKPKRSTFRTFTKKWVERLMYIAVIDLQLSYLLAFLGREQIAEELSRTIVVEIVGVMLGYFCKAYFETREGEKIRLQEKVVPVQPVEEMEDEDL